MKNIMDIVDCEGEIMGRVLCNRMMQNDPYTCEPIVTKAGAKTIKKLMAQGTIYNGNGKYRPRIVGYIVEIKKKEITR